ncbi:class I SAM-dependent DNA methyltransferase [Flavobacterium psychrophilum]|jgi:type II restriction/modification system DNA methylase subunit YeeA|uniref:class I SAM-dependent DNA methyltransferase n=1 Tax=Flavobacterium psychrophilum TaxID=96345 RepID=UPI000B7C22A7|nr:DNA methyltransferase [Flavobacterium psychrophilum]MBF1998625.1 class I SAM-dependent DNA methyltransferase [Flavobacterium psychrophilum]MBF2082336.1 class I SAM-dependent DNA methyltransferase [Flavobacterium psychrophilum]MCB5981828.1 class I SAM-dependent DNA methyltransferase [Flavobacterium psychrophilum]MCB6002945.1 class I SAM-dependent DNA methyltransferase [Flavobacterium psychrophilum]MCB6012872.1 class I SAM-dependent DNA methyltransferase [Flavobacterium psychrophilum]
MALSWNEIKERAVKFSKEWAEYSNEEADAKPFLVEFFNVFGIYSKKVATFEHRVKKLDERDGYIDLLWKGTILIEMKSRGKNLDKAFQQAKDYLHGLKQHELPKYILVSDFEIFKLYDLEEENIVEFKILDLVNNVQSFGFLLGYQKKVYKEQDPANIKAAEFMGKLHDRLKEIGYDGHPLEVYLVRLLFCLFAEDTTIFNKQQFQDYIEFRTNEDGSDLAPKLQELFQVLDTPSEKRFKNLDEQLAEFPYVNGKLFQEILPMASFDTKMRKALLDCCYIDWSKISPAIFGSMFQSVMNPKERRNLGAHYTSETNILKLIKPLFLDELWAEFENIKNNKNKLPEFHKKISLLKFLDPACGCGNFLVITYRELRLLEIAVLRALNKSGQGFLDVSEIIWLDVDMMGGIEYEEFPARIAEVAMWLIDHQMNMLISNEFGQYFARLPLKKSAKIVHGDALEVDWESVVPKEQLCYILGNPPFIGSKIMTQLQRNQIVKEFDNIQGSGVLDYVTGWYIKSAKFIQNTKIKVAFVSTNSIVQGEQTSILWGQMLNKFSIKIHFAHRTFKWSNEAKGNAAVYCVIVGFANYDTNNKSIFEYDDIKGEALEIKAKNINPYLVDAKDLLINKSSNPICNVPKMSFGNMPLDGGHLLLSDIEKSEFILKEPKAEKFIIPLISAYEFLNGEKRWCIWLVDAEPSELKQLPEILKRVEAVKKFRLDSVAPSTQKFATTPSLFRDRNQPETYILIPSTTSENRKYIPLGFFNKDHIANNSCHTIPNGSLYHFGILMSSMHMAWVKSVCGRLESRYRYSKDIVYNNFPWAENPSEKQIRQIEEKAQKVLEVRSNFPKSSLADLYNPLTMPPTLIKAHNDLDKAVDSAYRTAPFTSEANRMVYLFELYEKYTADLFTKEKSKKKK